MTRATIAGRRFAIVLVLLIIAIGYLVVEQNVDPAPTTSTAATPSTAAAEAHPSFLYGRVTIAGGATYEGRLRWGRDQEAFWGDYFSFNDFDDGVRVWDGRQGVLDLGPRQIRTIDLLSATQAGAIPPRLYATVRTRQGDFTGFVQWNRKEAVGPDELDGRTAEGDLSLRFDTIRSIARHAGESSLVTLLDGREIVLSDTPEAGHGNLGIYVDDRRYGRVLISWDAFERLDFSPGGSGPAYGDFPPGRPLTGSVTTRAGRRLAGRLVYDLDESETTETLDAPSQGVDYTIPFGMIASIMLPGMLPGREERGAQRARVTLHNGEVLLLELTGDLGEGNAGMLIFVDGSPRPEYVLWTDVEQVDFERPPSMYPP